jgi:hypothetical protein
MWVLVRGLGCYIETGGRPVPTARRHPCTVASDLRATARAARCFSFSTCRIICELQRARASRGPERRNVEEPSLIMGTIAPPRALWRASTGWNTAHDGWVRGGVLVRGLGCYIETGGRPVPTARRHPCTVASDLRATAREARCFSFSTCRSSCELQRARA